MDRNRAPNSRLSRQRIGSITHLRISGTIDETFSPQHAAEDLLGQVILDLGRVERISSFGVRKWMEFVGKLPNGAVALYIIHAPPVIVDQLNLVEGFSGLARVLSLLAPYRCPKCQEERIRLVDVVAEYQTIASGQAPQHSCPECSVPLTFSEPPAEFFDFIRNQQVGTVDPAVARFIRALHPVEAAAPDEPAVSKLLVDDVTYFRLSGTINSELNVRRLSAGLEGRVVFDLASVTHVDPRGLPRLLQVFDAVSASAELLLWRVPLPVLSALADAGVPIAGKLCTVWIPSECVTCGMRSFFRVDATEYLRNLQEGQGVVRECSVCGGRAKQVQHRELIELLDAVPKLPPPAELEAVELRAFSQYLSTPSNLESGGTGEQVTLQGRLQILRRIGQGGMAEVFLARQQGVKGFEKYVVVKKVLAQYAQSPEFVEMLFAEARANARLTHPNIVQLFDVGMDQGSAYITMEYVRGPDLKKLLGMLRKKGLQLPLEHALRIVAETAAGLHYAHSYVDPTGKPHPMVHRDVSPHNILVSLDGAIKLSDFGIAKMQGDAENTKAGVLKGKINYVSPEAVSGMRVDARSDVFALGVVLFELLTGKLPFRRDSEAATLASIVRDPAPSPSVLNPAVPEDISAIVLWALEKDLDRRMATAAQMREAIESSLARHRMSSSPSAVAQFFRAHLGAELAEFDPSGAASIPGGGEGSGPRMHSAPAMPVPLQPVTKQEPRPELPFTPPPAASRPARAVEPAPPTALEKTSSLRPPGKGREASVDSRPAPPPAPASEVPERTEIAAPSGRGRKIALIAGAAGLLAAAVAVVMLRSPRGGTEVSQLGPDEHLYVQGLRVDPEKLHLEGDSLIVAVGRDGKLLRFGTASGGKTLNAGALVEVAPGANKGEEAELRLESAPAGCTVKLGGEMLPTLTPTRFTIPAGKELSLDVLCPGKADWSRMVMAIPGQQIDVQVKTTEG